MDQIVECVANISEGKNQFVLSEISNAIRSVEGSILLHTDIGYDANRTVFTFAGSLNSLRHSVIRMYKTALELIDMRVQHGTHPRIGVVDVCPFIPIRGIDMEDLIPWVDQLAKDIAQEFSLAVYLYEESAMIQNRKNLAVIRKGQYESLAHRNKTNTLAPDYGQLSHWQKSGASVIGARQFLLAYNINIDSSNVSIAKSIAKKIRASGYIDNSGQRISGLFSSVKSIGWYIEEYGFAQVSTNLTNFNECSLHEVFEACKRFALEFNTTVTGSELIGLTPLEPLLIAGQYYGHSEMTESDLIQIAQTRLGLSAIKPFIPEEKIIEYVLNQQLGS